MNKQKVYEIRTYKRSNGADELHKTHVSFCGILYKKPADPKKVILIVNPSSTNAFYYEFKFEDITYAEKLTNLVNLEGEAIIMTRIWVKQGSIGVHSTHFLVDGPGC